MRAVLSFAFVIVVIAGCNTVAGIEPAGVRKSADPESDDLALANGNDTPDLAPPTSNGNTTAPPLPHDAGPPGPCDKYPNAKFCDGKCVMIDDANYGCTLTGCQPCMLAHASSKCDMKTFECVIAQCADEDWQDCDGKASNGCEQDMDSTATCGGCGTKCATGQTCSHGSCI